MKITLTETAILKRLIEEEIQKISKVRFKKSFTAFDDIKFRRLLILREKIDKNYTIECFKNEIKELTHQSENLRINKP